MPGPKLWSHCPFLLLLHWCPLVRWASSMAEYFTCFPKVRKGTSWTSLLISCHLFLIFLEYSRDGLCKGMGGMNYTPVYM